MPLPQVFEAHREVHYHTASPHRREPARRGRMPRPVAPLRRIAAHGRRARVHPSRSSRSQCGQSGRTDGGDQQVAPAARAPRTVDDCWAGIAVPRARQPAHPRPAPFALEHAHEHLRIGVGHVPERIPDRSRRSRRRARRTAGRRVHRDGSVCDAMRPLQCHRERRPREPAHGIAPADVGHGVGRRARSRRAPTLGEPGAQREVGRPRAGARTPNASIVASIMPRSIPLPERSTEILGRSRTACSVCAQSPPPPMCASRNRAPADAVRPAAQLHRVGRILARPLASPILPDVLQDTGASYSAAAAAMSSSSASRLCGWPRA
jgi:hypothetical protein